MSFILNGKAYGDVAEVLLAHNFDVGVLRPWIGSGGRTFITRNGKPELVGNAPATLRKDEWVELDKAVLKAAMPRLKLVSDLRSRGLVYSVPNGMGKTVFTSENSGDINDAEISMDGLRQTVSDRPEYDTVNLPLPITHKDFFISARQLAASRNGSTPLDTTMAELAGRKVAEKLEKLALGQLAEYTFGGGTIYGLTNWTKALSQVLTAPTAGGWTGATLVNEILQMRETSQAAHYYGPWALYTSPKWDMYLDDDYSSAKGDNTLRERIAKIAGISGITTLDYMENWDIVMVQLTPDVIRMIVGMEVTTLQWDTMGGLKKHFKVMTIQVPQLRADQNDNTGIVYGKTA